MPDLGRCPLTRLITTSVGDKDAKGDTSQGVLGKTYATVCKWRSLVKHPSPACDLIRAHPKLLQAKVLPNRFSILDFRVTKPYS